MIPEIDELLREWGLWQRTNTGSSGPGSSLVQRYGPRGSHGKGLVIHRNTVAERIDLLVCELGDVLGSHYRRLLVGKYVWQDTHRSVAERENCSVDIIKKRIDTAHAWLLGVLHGRMHPMPAG